MSKKMSEEAALQGRDIQLKNEAIKAKVNLAELKSGGFIKQIQKDLFTVRLRCPGGRVTADKLVKAAELADKYGRGEVHITVRQSIEIPYVNFKDFDALVEELKEVEWSVASCGPRVRVPTGCAGCTYNPNALVDTQRMCMEVDRRYFGTPTGHHKFKISFSSCALDCFRTREMDLGFQGVVKPMLIADLCKRGCDLCVKNCEEGALTMKDGIPVRDLDKCIGCGGCIKICPFDAMVPKKIGWLVRVGGKHGKHPIYAYEVANYVSDEEIFPIIEKTLAWYKEKAEGRERIGAAIVRRGIKEYIDEVIMPLGLEEVIEDPKDRRKFKASGNFYE